MRILKEGIRKKPEDKEYKKKCFYCKCEYTYKREDIQYLYDDINYLECPYCECANSVPLIKRVYKGE